jgi:hypothetical protein
VQPSRRQDKGPHPKPRWTPLPQLLYAQVVKTMRRRRLVRVRHRVVFGTLEAVEQVLSACGWQSQTAFVERLNLDIRQRVAATGRRVNTLCQGEDSWLDQLGLFQVYHNFVLPHASLRQPLLIPEVTNGRGSARVWRPCTPAMAAGLTDHVWTLKEVLLYQTWPKHPLAMFGSTGCRRGRNPKLGNGLARKMIMRRSRDEHVYKPARRRERGAENTFRGLMTD